MPGWISSRAIPSRIRRGTRASGSSKTWPGATASAGCRRSTAGWPAGTRPWPAGAGNRPAIEKAARELAGAVPAAGPEDAAGPGAGECREPLLDQGPGRSAATSPRRPGPRSRSLPASSTRPGRRCRPCPTPRDPGGRATVWPLSRDPGCADLHPGKLLAARPPRPAALPGGARGPAAAPDRRGERPAGAGALDRPAR